MTKKIQLIAVLLLMAIHIYPQDVAPMIQTHWGQGSPYNGTGAQLSWCQKQFGAAAHP